MTDRVTLTTINSSGLRGHVTLEIPDRPPLTVMVAHEKRPAWEVHGVDLFECLIEIRKDLESKGILLCCQGARPDVFPSGMARQMGDGRFAYHLRRDRKITSEDMVDIFSPAEPSEVVSIEDQRNAVLNFYKHEN
ncbi:hypothetical protein GCM10022252_00720 [Streptosporangium oxazolinicum]|uniref:Uncharacterized protein n=1 Tax=Streptosporangium oxazolinicum TaxID=909287 RepID=A0ABP8A7E4_9ACTN